MPLLTRLPGYRLIAMLLATPALVRKQEGHASQGSVDAVFAMYVAIRGVFHTAGPRPH